MRSLAILAFLVPLLAACSQEEAATIPAPAVMTEEAVGHYCQMYLLEHPGPKAHAYLEGYPAPLWFSQVRDAVEFQRSPEKIAEIVIIYVSDMGAAPSWEDPGNDNWIRAEDAYYVVGAAIQGGMGAPEFVPFAQEKAGLDFIASHGGTLMRFAEIPDEALLDTGQAPEGSE